MSINGSGGNDSRHDQSYDDDSPVGGMTLAEEMERALGGDRHSVNAVIHSAPNEIPAVNTPKEPALQYVSEIVELNRRIRDLQREVFHERLVNERREREDLIRENTRLRSLQQPNSAPNITATTTIPNATTPFLPTVSSGENQSSSVYSTCASITAADNTPLPPIVSVSRNPSSLVYSTCAPISAAAHTHFPPVNTYATNAPTSTWQTFATAPSSLGHPYGNIPIQPSVWQSYAAAPPSLRPINATTSTGPSLYSNAFPAVTLAPGGYTVPASQPPSSRYSSATIIGVQPGSGIPTMFPNQFGYAGQGFSGTTQPNPVYIQPDPARQMYVQQPSMYAQQPAMYNRAPDNRRTHELPIFSGRAEEWPLFSSTYISTTEQFGYSDLENVLRLQKCLKGEAKKKVESLLIYPNHVGRVMDVLEREFGRPEQLVRSQIALVKGLPTLTESHLDHLGEFAVSVQNLATFLDTERTREYLWNPALIDDLVQKLPMSRRIEWARESSRFETFPNIAQFAQWLTNEASFVNLATNKQAMPPRGNAPGFQNHPAKRSTHKILLSNQESSSHLKCSFCSEAHTIETCNQILQLSIDDRWHEVSKLPLCYCCLRQGHLLPSCNSKEKCGVDGCTRYHHPMLHRPTDTGSVNSSRNGQVRRRGRRNPQKERTSPNPNASTAPASPRPGASKQVYHCCEEEEVGTLLFRVVPVTLYGPRETTHTFALLDEGSSVTLVDKELAETLQLDGDISTLNLQWFGNQSTTEQSKKVSMQIGSDADSSARYTLRNVRTVNNLKLPIQSVDRGQLIRENPHLSEIPFSSYHRAEPKILLGLDHHHLGLPKELRTNADHDGIVAARTSLGWIIYGSDKNVTQPGAVALHIDDGLLYEQQQLNELVRSHFTTEDFGAKIPAGAIESDEIIRARGLLFSTTTRLEQGNFETGLLWKRDDVVLPDSYPMALKRLEGIESKMRRDPQFANAYRAQIDSYVAKGYARELTKAEATSRSNRTWFLPHFATRNVNKPEKIRLVFDAAAAVRGVSLNSELLSGPDVNIPLTRILFKFRLGEIGVCADIQEMFHQVKIRAADQDSQRFLWRDGDNKEPPKTFVMQSMTFGATCSPASAQYVKNLNAREFAVEMPEAAYQIQDHHYVDDFVASFANAEDAIRITADVVQLHRRGGFLLRGIKSNDSTVRTKLGDDNSHSPVSFESDTSTEKILGMSWDTSDDTFRFQTRFSRVRPDIISGKMRPTKREILSLAMSIFDPFGLLANFTLEAKIIIQELWRLNIGWDDLLPEHLNARFQIWRQQIEKTQLVRVPRCYAKGLQSSSNVELHVFADASETAFAAVAYWRIQHGETIQLAFVAGKVRCAPLKLLSVPRLELQAAVLASRLMTEIVESHEEINIRRKIMWSDSETVLKWINSDQRKYKQFVAFRVAEITENAPSSTWRWVPTALNVADDATRFQHPYYFDPDSRWLRGPEWLRDDEADWPATRTLSEDIIDENETRKNYVGVIHHNKQVVDFARFSKFHRLNRTIAWVLRFASNCRKANQRQRGELTAADVLHAVGHICRLVQQEAYPNEIADLRAGQQIPQSSKVFVLKPYLDDNGILRVHGRTDAADDSLLGQNAKRPILLPAEHRFTHLLVQHQHEQNAHQLVDATIAAVRAAYWIPSLRALVRKVTNSCMFCRVRAAQPTIPIQGQLPADRLAAYVRPFTNTGLDFFGPVDVTIGRRREKRWVALFTCLGVRAVHLELAYNLSTDACLVCIRNFCNIRGIPSLIRCDNGTNFVGACNELKNHLNFFDTEYIQRELTVRGIEWRFNCPANPEAGGAWERLVQSVKRVLRVTLHEEAPQVETLRALLLEAANAVNSRPLTHVEVTPSDPEPITPNHFLLGGPNIATIPDPSDVEPRATRKQWQICRGLSRRFWKQWVRDYLPELTRRSKHYPEERPLQIDDLVFLCDSNLARKHWRRGRVIDVARGPDGVVRTATIRTSD